MQNWQLTLIVMASVIAGALIPLFIVLSIAVYRMGRAMGEVGTQLKRTLVQVEIISDRVEILSRGFKGGETTLAELLTSVGKLAHGLERNMKIINVASTVMASVGTALAAYVDHRSAAEEVGTEPGAAVPGNIEDNPPEPEGRPAAH